MRNLFLLSTLSILCFSLIGCGSKGASIPEFEGAYLVYQDGSYLKLNEQQGGAAKLIKKGMGMLEATTQPYVGYAVGVNEKNFVTIQSSDLKGFFFKGETTLRSGFMRATLSWHKAAKQTSGLYQLNEWTMNSPKPNNTDTYYSGQEIRCDKKKMDNVGGTMFVPKNNVTKGLYVAWLGKTLWFFKVL